MKPNSAVAAFLARLRDALPADSAMRSRILSEAEDHLLEAIADLRCRGLSEDEAAGRAIADFGSPEQIAEQQRAQAPKLREKKMRLDMTKWSRLSAAAGAISMLPALVFVVSSLLKYNLGVPLPFEPLNLFGLVPAVEPERIAPLALVGGAALAILLNLAGMAELKITWASRRIVSRVAFEWQPANAAVALAGFLLFSVIAVYVISENLMEARTGHGVDAPAIAEPVQKAFTAPTIIT